LQSLESYLSHAEFWAELNDVRQNYLLKTINTPTIITRANTLLFNEKCLEGVKVYNIEQVTVLLN